MKFIDEAKIYIKGGHGGRGCVSFRREKYVPRGGPNGGDGGKGGDIIFHATEKHRTLLDFKYRQHHIAKNGGHGSGNNRTGRSAADLEIAVPVGTIIKDAETQEILADLSEIGQNYVAARGGIGGKGNAHFATSTHQAPKFAQEGMEAEERWVLLELKLLADIGIVGFPNAGKSTFISRVSAARPKIADYPFTTLSPYLGVVKHSTAASFVIADIPGLISGAHEGMGMGIKFLKHIERTSALLHIIDISTDPYTNAWKNFTAINNELGLYDAALLKKPQIVALNKIDLPFVREQAKKEVALFKKNGIILHTFSAVTGEGVDKILNRMVSIVHKKKKKEKL
ncbi:MAG TPA: GTPase ObgE [Deltaproteobacteria bacterium]|nr:GTPase ObgE [Deltaproteobacteria bacterium]